MGWLEYFPQNTIWALLAAAFVFFFIDENTNSAVLCLLFATAACLGLVLGNFLTREERAQRKRNREQRERIFGKYS
jgi:hypothetical protein